MGSACSTCTDRIDQIHATVEHSSTNRRTNKKTSGLIYENKEKVFSEMVHALNDGKVVHDADQVDNDLYIMDVECGNGIYTKLLCNKFLTDDKDALICLDSSPKSLQFVQNKVIEKDKNLKNKRLIYMQNEKTSLCLNDRYNTNTINLCLMAFTITNFTVNDGSRDIILKEIYNALKGNGILVIFESIGVDDNINNDDYKPLQDDENDKFKTTDDICKYVESFGFKFEKFILKDVIGDKECVIVFGK